MNISKTQVSGKSGSQINLAIGLTVLFSMQCVRGLELDFADFHFCFGDIMIVDSLKGADDTANHYRIPKNGYSVIDTDTFSSINDTASLPHCIFILHHLPKTRLADSIKIKIAALLSSRNGRKPIVYNFLIASSNISSLQVDWEKDLSNIYNPIDSDFYSVLLSSNIALSVRETYSIKHTKIHNEVAKPEDTNEFADFWYTLTSKVARRRNFQEAPIVVIARNGTSQKDWMNLRLGRGNQITLIDGFSVFLIRDFQMLLNFSIQAVWGDAVVTLSNNSLGGTSMKLLQDGSADISLSQSNIVPFRAKFLTFLQPSYSGIIHIFFRQPSSSSINNVAYAPFSLPVWITLCSLWISILLLIKLNMLLKRISYNTILTRSQREDINFIHSSSMWVFGATSLKSWHFVPTSFSLKLIMLMGSFLSLIMYVAYSGEIVSALSVNTAPIRSLLQLIDYKFTFTVHTQSEPLKEFMQLLINELKLQQSVRTIKTEEEINHLLNPSQPKAFFTYPDLFHRVALYLNYTERYVCNTIYWMRYNNIPSVNALFLRKGSEYTETFNHKLQKLKEFGLNYRYAKNYDKKNSFSCVQSVAAQIFDPVVYSDLTSVFYFIYFGTALSLFLLLFELLYFKMQLHHSLISRLHKHQKPYESLDHVLTADSPSEILHS